MGALLVVLLVVGCSGSQGIQVTYDGQSNQTTYKTDSYVVSTLSGGGIADSKSIEMQTIARCRGPDCTPTAAQLVFSASGNQELYLSGTGGQISANDTRVSWNSRSAGITHVPTRGSNELRGALTVVGKFASVEVPLEKLTQIAEASSVEGSIGGVSLALDSSVQAGLRNLVRKVRGGAPAEDSLRTDS